MKTTNISTLKIHKLTQEQYERELANGNIDENALYFTPDETNGGGITEIPSEYITESELDAKGYLTEHQSLDGYALKTEIPEDWFGTGTSIPSNSDLDTYTTAGKYYVSSTSIAGTIANAPVTNTNYTLFVMVRTSSKSISQIIFALNNKIYMRSATSTGVFGDWQTFATMNDLSKYAEQSDVNELAQEIANNSTLSYGTCETAGATAEKVVTIDNENWELKVGSVVMVYFTTSNSASSVKLNVNGTGAYPIWYNNAEYTSTGTGYTGYAQRVINYMFNGTHWVWIGASYDSNTTYTNVKLGHGYATCTTAESTVAKVGTLSSYTLTVGGIVAVKFTYGVPASATLNINSKGAKKIFYRGSAITSGIIKAGDIATFIYDGTQYQLMSIDRWQNDINALKNYVTPQMFGAKGDGVTDDTQAVQSALDNGGLIYFPAGRYKVTSLLTASKSCRIEMFKQYPNCYQPSDAGNYPLTSDDNWMGSRIETYSPNGGMVLGASAEVDGLYIRAMTGFAGILLKFDEGVGLFNYPSTVRISHVRLDIDHRDTIPSVMFDFVPKGSYRYILDDINIGRRHIEFCEYGFRADLSQVSNSNWANNVTIRNLCVDLFADYPLYVNGAKRATAWLFEELAIQTYPYKTIIENGYGNGRTRHKDIVTIKNLQEVTFISCYLWDLIKEYDSENQYDINFENIFVVENTTLHDMTISCIGCSYDFDKIENALSKQMEYSKNFNIKNLGMDIVVDTETNDSQLTLSDTHGNIQRVTLPGANLSDEQVEAGVGKWMDENSVPYEAVGKNKVDVTSEDFITGKYDAGGYLATNTNMAVTNYIEAYYKDIIRISREGNAVSAYGMTCYDKDKNYLAFYDIRSGNSHGISPTAIEVLKDGTAYVRISMTTNTTGSFATLESNQLCITVNNSDIRYEPYKTYIAGGLGELIILQAPNGTRYSVAVNDDGYLVAQPVDETLEPVNPKYTLTDEDKTTITNEVIANLSTEDWVFTLEDDTTVTKKVVVK